VAVRGKRTHEDEDLFMTVALFYFSYHDYQKKYKENKRRFWVGTTPNKRNIHGGDELLIDLRNDDTGLVGNYDRFNR
jgi:hypothetical protein